MQNKLESIKWEDNLKKHKWLSVILVMLLFIVVFKYTNDIIMMPDTKIKNTGASNKIKSKEDSLNITNVSKDYTNPVEKVKNHNLKEIESILNGKVSIIEYENKYGISLVYDKEKKMYRSEEYDICGTKGVLYWKIDNEILNEAYIDFEACNKELSPEQDEEIIAYLNSTVGKTKEARHQMGGWFYRIWESDNIRYYLGSGSYSDIGPYNVEFTASKFSKPVTAADTSDEIITMMQKFSGDDKIKKIVNLLGKPTEENDYSVIYKNYKRKFNGLKGNVIVFYIKNTSNIDSILWEYNTDNYLNIYEKCIDYLNEQFGDCYASPKEPEKKIWNDFSLFYVGFDKEIILKKRI